MFFVAQKQKLVYSLLMQTKSKAKIVLIGLDGVSFGLIDDLAKRGAMPNFQALKSQSFFSKMQAPLPAVSSVSWSSIITGKNPGEHGIYGFMDLADRSYDLLFPNFNDLRAPAFWQKYPKLKHVVLNMPSTYPAKPLNGVHIAGFVSPDFEGAVFPANYLAKLREMKYEVDVDSELAHRDIDLFLENLFKVNQARVNAYRYFWREIDWDVFWLVFTGTDRLGHFLMPALLNPNHQYHEKCILYFQEIDRIIGEIANQLDGKDQLLIFSDHGMTETICNVNVNYFLAENGFLQTDKQQGEFYNLSEAKISSFAYNQITNQTKAFALEPGRIYLNKKGKYPRGSVGGAETEQIIEQLTAAFLGIEFQGKKVIDKVYKKQEIYSGKEMNKAPDLVLAEKDGFRLRAGLNKKELFDKDIFQGTHTANDAFLLVKSSQAANFSLPNPKAEDIIQIMTNPAICPKLS